MMLMCRYCKHDRFHYTPAGMRVATRGPSINEGKVEHCRAVLECKKCGEYECL